MYNNICERKIYPTGYIGALGGPRISIPKTKVCRDGQVGTTWGMGFGGMIYLHLRCIGTGIDVYGFGYIDMAYAQGTCAESGVGQMLYLSATISESSPRAWSKTTLEPIICAVTYDAFITTACIQICT